jgi:glycine cleavage system H protein
MFPFNYGFHWNIGTIIFLGLFYFVVIAIGVTCITAVLRTRRTMRVRTLDTIRWKTDFHDLPHSARACRYEFDGTLEHYTCDHRFDCRSCPIYTQYGSQQAANPESENIVPPNAVYGFSLPANRLYYRGHTWVKLEEDGTYTVGLDNFAQRLMGSPDTVTLPSVGTTVELNGKAWEIQKGTSSFRILSPLDGEVAATGDGSEGWFLKIKSAAAEINTSHLLNAHEAALWIQREFDRLKIFLADPKLGLPLAEGETPIQNFTAAYPEKNWDKLYCNFFLEA